VGRRLRMIDGGEDEKGGEGLRGVYRRRPRGRKVSRGVTEA